MTNQEAFDRMVEHLKTQKRRSADRGQCRYRGPDGLKCVVGCLIPDDEYRPGMDEDSCTTGVGYVVRDFDPPSLRGVSMNLLMSMQDVHDKSWNWNESGFIGWGEVRITGLRHGLDVSGVPNA